MKTNKATYLWLFLLLLTSCSVSNKSVTNKKTLQQKVESKDFTIFVSRCLPTDLVNSPFNSDVVLKLKNDKAYANLPFHGLLNVKQLEAPTDPISFDGPMKELTINPNSAGGWDLSFKVESDPYTYQVIINISTKGKAVVKITSTKRSTMTYFGEVD